MFKFIRNTLLVGGLLHVGYVVGLVRGATATIQASEDDDYEFLKNAIELNEKLKGIKG